MKIKNDSQETQENENEDESQGTKGIEDNKENQNEEACEEAEVNENEDDYQGSKDIEENKENRNEEICEGTEVNENEDSGPICSQADRGNLNEVRNHTSSVQEQPSQRLTRSMKKGGEQGKRRESIRRR